MIFINNKSSSKYNIKKIYPMCEYVLNFNGCCNINIGFAGIGVVLYKNGEELWGGCKFITHTNNNNEAEYNAIIYGLEEAIKNGINSLSVYGDNKLIINQLNGIHNTQIKNEKIFKLYHKVLVLKDSFDFIEFSHVLRKYNKRASDLANMSL